MAAKTLCVDFDGVIYPNLKYFSVADLRGGPVEGAREGLIELAQSFTVVVHSARCAEPEGVEAIRSWLALHGLPYEVVADKPRAAVYIDDRAVCFEGDWFATVEAAKGFRQWQTDDKLRGRIQRKRRQRARR